jgi:hypothetical protein
LGKLTAHRRQVRRSRPQVALQLRHLCLEGRLLACSGLGGFSGSGFAAAAAVLALSATSSADAAAARSFSISASASTSLDASESLSVTAVTAAVSAEMARSSAD